MSQENNDHRNIANLKAQYRPGVVRLTHQDAMEDTGPLPYDVSKCEAIYRTSGGFLDTFRNIDTNVSVRDGFNQKDFDYFRGDEAEPLRHNDIIKACDIAYKKVGIIRNIIDTMADFACQGIELVHPDPKVQQFYRNWFIKVGGKQVSERFLNYLYRMGTVVVQRRVAKLKPKDVRKLEKSYGEADYIPLEKLKTGKNEIPFIYNFLDICSLEIIGKELAVFTGQYNYATRISNNLKRKITNPQGIIERKMAATVPEYIKKLLNSNQNLIPLDPDKISSYWYKKDDWDLWASPMLECILDDLIDLRKMQLADRTTLDGIISQVRLWKLGNIDKGLMPHPNQLAGLSSILLNNMGGGALDLVWGPDIELVSSESNAHTILGSAKYEPVMARIFQGLGIPPTLTGSATASGFTNNFISLKTLIERLNYGRDVLASFWQKELVLLQEAFGFKEPARVHFTFMTLSDAASEKNLLMQLVDRGVMSDETLLERFRELPEIERARLVREQKARKSGKLPRKAGPWNNPEFEEDLQKVALQAGSVTPGQLGMELEDKLPGEKTANDMALEIKKVQIKNTKKGQPGQGRPLNKKDSVKRQTKTVKPRTKAEILENYEPDEFTNLFLWARDAQSYIADQVNPLILKSCGKDNMRKLNDTEAENAETLKFAILCSFEPYHNIKGEEVINLFNQTPTLSLLTEKIYKSTVAEYVKKFAKEPPLEHIRHIQGSVYSLMNTSYTEE